MNRITSFSVDHRKIEPGLYISRIDGDATTFDMRFKKPNTGDLLTNVEMHSLEHMFATYVRNSDIANSVLYFGPMGCQTGFYLIIREVELSKIKNTIKDVLDKITNATEMFGCSEEECGNYRSLDLENAKKIAKEYYDILMKDDFNFKYGN